MISYLKKLLAPSPEALAEMREQVKKEIEDEKYREAMRKEQEAAAAEEAARKHEAELQAELEKVNQERMNSDEPWVEMVGSSVDPERGLKVELNWNPAFIKYLREGGVQGTSEEECAQRWLAMVAKDVDSRQVDDDNDGKDNSEYQ